MRAHFYPVQVSCNLAQDNHSKYGKYENTPLCIIIADKHIVI